MLLHHSNKASRDGSQTGAQAYRDATAIFDSVRAAWYLRSLKEEELTVQSITPKDGCSYMLLENSKNNYLPVCPDRILQRDGYRYTMLKITPKLSKEERKERKSQAECDSVVRILQTAKGSRYTFLEVYALIKETLSITRSRLGKIMDELKLNGLVERVDGEGSPKYKLSADGEAYNLGLVD
jgi:hypothetical protein